MTDMEIKIGEIARIVKDAFEPKNIGVTVRVVRRALPDECVGGELNYWIVRPTDPTRMLWTASDVNGITGFWTNGEVGVGKDDIEPLSIFNYRLPVCAL